MSTDLLREKTSLRAYLEKRGISYNAKRKTWRCPNHDDQEESAVLYENPEGGRLWCPVCNQGWDIFNICGLLDGISDDKSHFPEKLKRVRETLGIPHEEKKRKSVPVPFPENKKQEFNEKIKSLEPEKGKITGSWKYEYPEGIMGIDVRYEKEGERKQVLTFWYDGKNLKWAGAPVLIYNLKEAMESEKPIIIHEGAKCSDKGKEEIQHFTHVSWSGGSGKATQAEWSFCHGKEIYIYPDDDDAGIKAARKIYDKINGIANTTRIINPAQAGREIKKKGADIVEILQVMSTEEFTAYALDPANHMDVSDICSEQTPKNPSKTSSNPGSGPFSEPFKILGMGDGEAHFIDMWGYYQHYKLSTLSRNRLNELADLTYWSDEYPSGKDFNVGQATDYIITASKIKQFDIKRLKGRGCWRSGEKICYHDGIKTYGDIDENFIYIKLERHEMGLESEPAGDELLKKIRELIFSLSFETKTDAVRCMGWSALAPFCGALTFRPTILLTGESGWGKSRVQTLFIKKITDMLHFDMRTTSEAGIRRKIGMDSRPAFFDEGGKETDKMKINFDTIIAYIRSSYSDDSPDGVKANLHSEGTVSYKNSSMFGIASTDPTIENIQDENRIIHVNFKKPTHTAEEWQEIENKLEAIMNKENCDAVRSLTWQRLKSILVLSKKMVSIARSKTGCDYRSSYADMLLAAAYIVVWENNENPTEEEIIDKLNRYYQNTDIKDNRNDAEEMVDRILDEQIEILNEGKRKKFSIGEILIEIYEFENSNPEYHTGSAISEINEYRNAICRHGINLTAEFNLAIRNNHHFIKKLINRGNGYSRILKRHPGFLRDSEHKHIYFHNDKKPYRCSIIDIGMRKKEENIKQTEVEFE